MIRSKDEWKREVESGLPPQERFVERNRAITSHYARLYLANRGLFKWAGMAAFASNQVGMALALSELMHMPRRTLDGGEARNGGDLLQGVGDFFGDVLRMAAFLPLSALDFAAKNMLLDDLEEVRAGNNNIYNDIAWAHAAYLEGGLAEVEANIGEAERQYMLSGFALIDEGAALLKSGGDPRRAETLVRKGNVGLLRHEQTTTLQPIFDAISSAGRVAVSFGSELNFGEAAPPGTLQRASFADHFGYPDVLSGKRSVTSSEDRWQWIEENVLPAWRAVDEGFAEWKGAAARFRAMAAGETNLLQQAAHFGTTLSFLQGMES